MEESSEPKEVQQSPQEVAKQLRIRVSNEEELSLEEVRQAVALLREGRKSACFASLGAAKKKEPKVKKKKGEAVEELKELKAENLLDKDLPWA